ncbi:hypothetical protein ACOMHN_044207 [Nucella lapillus]
MAKGCQSYMSVYFTISMAKGCQSESGEEKGKAAADKGQSQGSGAKSSQKKRPKKKRSQEESKTGEEEVPELGSDDLPTESSAKDDAHEEL